MGNGVKHTPGPWEVGNDCGDGTAIVTYQARDICRVEMHYGDGPANAALIASAPALAERVRVLEGALERIGGEPCHDCDIPCVHDIARSALSRRGAK